MAACDERLPALVDQATGALDPQGEAALEAHLAACPGCRDEGRALRSATALLAATSDVPEGFALSGFAARTAARAETFRDRSARGLWWSLTRGVRLALGLSAGALAASLALFLAAPAAPSPASDRGVAPAAEETFAEADLAPARDTTVVTLDSAFDALSGDDLEEFDQLLEENPT